MSEPRWSGNAAREHANTHTHIRWKSELRGAKRQQPNQRLAKITTPELKSGCARPAEYETRGGGGGRGGSRWIYGESTGSPRWERVQIKKAICAPTSLLTGARLFRLRLVSAPHFITETANEISCGAIRHGNRFLTTIN